MAERIQRHPTEGWRMPEGAIYVGRPGPWGNQFKVIKRIQIGWQVFKCIGYHPTEAEAIAAPLSTDLYHRIGEDKP